MKKNIFIITLAIFLFSCSSSKTKSLEVEDVEVPAAMDKEVKEEFTVKNFQSTVVKKVELKKETKTKINIVKEETKAENIVEVKAEPDTPKYYNVGDKFSYTAYALGLKAGYVSLEVLPFKYIKNQKAYHFKADVSTTSIFKSVYYVNDLVESFVDAEKFYSLRYQIKAEEGKAKKQKIELYDSAKKTGFLWKKVIENGKTNESQKNIDITPYSQDILSSLFYAKTVNYSVKEHSFNVVSGEKNKKVKLSIQSQESLTYNDKEYNCYKVFLIFNDEKLTDNIYYYYSPDLKQIVKIVVPLKLGSVTMELQ